MSHSTAFSQTAPALLLPSETNGSVQLNISATPNLNAEKLGYQYLSVFVQNEGAEYSENAVQGRHTIKDDYLVFTPYFPFEKGMRYLVKSKQTDIDNKYAYQSFQAGTKQAVEKAAILSIYPSASELPENLLRFYLYFNTPMKKGQALAHIYLMDAEGNIDKQAFMEFKQELWSPDGKRLTILFDPGRIKRGVSTNMELGPALLEGKRYYLCVSGTWQDVYGQELLVETKKEFVVDKAYRQHIKVSEWVIHKPEANSFDALNIHIGRVMDHALIQSMIQLKDEEMNLIAGQWEILDKEQLIRFIPEKMWHNGKYQILIDSRLEDVAGNNLQNLLDQKQTDEKHHSYIHQFIDFEIMPDVGSNQ